MCRNYLALHNLEIPEKLKDKRQSVSDHKALMKDQVDILQNVKVQPLICSLYKMISSLMTSDSISMVDLKIYIKQYLNEVNRFDKISNKVLFLCFNSL